MSKNILHAYSTTKDGHHRLLFWMLIILAQTMLWAAPYYPSTDGTTHGYMGMLIMQLLSGKETFYAQHYALMGVLVPNSICQYMMAGLMLVFPFFTSIKLFVALLLVLYMVSLRRFFSFFSSKSWLSYYLPFLFLFTSSFIVGNFNHVFSLSLALLLAEFYVRSSGRWNVLSIITVCAGAMLLYFSHLFGFVVWGLIAGAYSVFSALLKYRNSKNLRVNAGDITVLIASTALPGFYLFNYAKLPKLPTEGMQLQPMLYALADIFHGVSFLSYRTDYMWIGPIIAITCLVVYVQALLTLRKQALSPERVTMLVLSLFFLALTLFGPDQLGSAWGLKRRYAQCFWICVLAYSASHIPPLHHKKIAYVFLCMFMLVAWRGYSMQSMQGLFRELGQVGDYIEPHSALLTLNINEEKTDYPELGTPTLFLVDPISQYGAYIAALKPVLWLGNYQMRERNAFPVRILPGSDPLEHLTPNFVRSLGEASSYDQIDLDLYRKRTSYPIRYVSIWGKQDYIKTERLQTSYMHIRKQLLASYKRIYVSEHGLLELWELKQ